jgi:chromosomal replication initiation ATPase DnaA
MKNYTPTVGFVEYLANKYVFNPNAEYKTYLIEQPQSISLETKMDAFCGLVFEKLNICKQDLQSKSRTEDLNMIRQIMAYIAFLNNWGNHKQIANYFNRDRTTAYNSVEVASHLIECRDKKFMSYFESFKHLLVNQ